MAVSDPYNRAFVAIMGRDKYDMSFITKESIRNQIKSDMTTHFPEQINNIESEIHVFYAKKMGVYPMEWCALVRAICLNQ